MNIIKFLETFTDDAVLKTGSRRDSIFTLGSNVAKASVPMAFLGLFLTPKNSVAGNLLDPADDGTPESALQLALMLEAMETVFYQTGFDTSGLIPAGRDRTVYQKLISNENAHKAAVISGLNSLGATIPTLPASYDFTADGMFDPFNNYDQFVAMTQAFEDTGVRAYKGQAHNLMSTPDLLTVSLQIHSAEARQAAMIRRLRNQRGWITQNQTDMPATAPYVGLQPTYNGEENINQAGVSVSNLTNSMTGPAIPAIAASQAFDEPLTRDQVLAIANMFM